MVSHMQNVLQSLTTHLQQLLLKTLENNCSEGSRVGDSLEALLQLHHSVKKMSEGKFLVRVLMMFVNEYLSVYQ